MEYLAGRPRIFRVPILMHEFGGNLVVSIGEIATAMLALGFCAIGCILCGYTTDEAAAKQCDDCRDRD